MGRRLPVELVVLPLLAVFVLFLSLSGWGAPDSLTYARLIGGPTQGPVWSGRLQIIHEESGQVVSAPPAAHEVRLRLSSGGHVTERVVKSGPDGWAEFSIPYPGAPGAARVEVLAADGAEVLARGQPQLARAEFLKSARRRSGVLAGHVEGHPQLSVRVVPPILSVPFAAELVLENLAETEQSLALELEGVVAEAAASQRILAQEELRVALKPVGHVATLKATVRPPVTQEGALEDDAVLGSVFTPLPVVPGAMSVERRGSALWVQSPIGRKELWVQVVGEFGRGPGARVPLSENESGTWSGQVPEALLAFHPKPKTASQGGATDPGRFLMVASEPDARRESVVGFPLDEQSYAFEVFDQALLDGGPAMRADVVRASGRRRLTLGAYVGLTGLLTTLAFIWRLRQADRRQRAKFEDAGVEEAARDKSLVFPVIALLSLFFAFSLAVLWIVAR